MKRLVQLFNFRKPDEMDLSITQTSIRFSWAFGIVCLAVWTIYESVNARMNNVPINFIPSALLVSQALILAFSKNTLYKRIVNSDDEKMSGKRRLAIAVLIAVNIVSWGIFCVSFIIRWTR